jgi:hypothetical protein
MAEHWHAHLGARRTIVDLGRATVYPSLISIYAVNWNTYFGSPVSICLPYNGAVNLVAHA